eukprot:jgi/Hompol1/4972/HPOL_004069-RA
MMRLYWKLEDPASAMQIFNQLTQSSSPAYRANLDTYEIAAAGLVNVMNDRRQATEIIKRAQQSGVFPELLVTDMQTRVLGTSKIN